MSTPTHLERLLEIGLLTPEERDSMLAHRWASELPSLESEAQVLVWAVTRSVLDEDELATLCDRPARGLKGDDYRLREKIVTEAHAMCGEVRLHFGENALTALLDEGLINEAQLAAGVKALPVERVLGSPAAALAWMEIEGVLSMDDWNEILSKVAPSGDAAASANARQIVTEAERIRQQSRAEVSKVVKAVLRAIFFSGPGLGLTLGGVLLVGFIGWKVFAPVEAPDCNATGVVKSINGILFMSGIAARSDAMSRLSGSGAATKSHGPLRLQGAREVGYAKALKVRGCIGTVVVGDKQLPFAYLVRPREAGDKNASEESDDFMVAGADAELVQARFSQIDAQGRYADQAQPVGRAQAEQAFRAGVQAFEADRARRSSGMENTIKRMQRWSGKSSLTQSDPRRTQAVAELEPLAPCREQDAGHRYVCRLMVEYNDVLLRALGRSSAVVLDADFTFTRDGPGDPWQMSENFASEFAGAMAQARMKSVSAAASASPGKPAPGDQPSPKASP